MTDRSDVMETKNPSTPVSSATTFHINPIRTGNVHAFNARARAHTLCKSTYPLQPIRSRKRRSSYIHSDTKSYKLPSLPSAIMPKANIHRFQFRFDDHGTPQFNDRHATFFRSTARDLKGRVVAYCTCQVLRIVNLSHELKSFQMPHLYRKHWKHTMYNGVLHASYAALDSTAHSNSSHETSQKDAFYFANGSCVFWGFCREEEAFYLKLVRPFCVQYGNQIQVEDMYFIYSDTSRIERDSINLCSNKATEKLAISFAMAQSTKLDVFEQRVEEKIRNTKHIPFNLAVKGSILNSQQDISRLIGRLFIVLADVNLHSDILDEPDFFWENDEYAPLYKKMIQYLDVNDRITILNKRLDILRELVQVLNQVLTQQHGAKLEWIIIWLLFVEIIISVGWEIIMKDLLRLF